MDFNGINLPDLTPRIDTSFIDEMNRLIPFVVKGSSG